MATHDHPSSPDPDPRPIDRDPVRRSMGLRPRGRRSPLHLARQELRTLRLPKPPFAAVSIAIIGVVASWVPLAFIARAWFNRTGEPRIHLIQDMDNQPRYKPQQANLLFADMRADRPKIPGTVALGRLEEDDHYNRGFKRTWNQQTQKYDVTYFQDLPAQVTLDAALLKRGAERFAINCAPCHGLDGEGNGPIHVRSQGRNPNWVQPSVLTDDDRRARPAGHIFNTITHGIRNMGGYGHTIPTSDRWAIVAYVKTLQFASHASPQMVPAEQAASMPVPKPATTAPAATQPGTK